MIDIVLEENRRLKAELNALRQIIIRVEPATLWDGRFEEMVSAPISTINIASELLAAIPHLKEQVASLPMDVA